MWNPADYMNCHFCGDKTNGQSFGRAATYLCGGCYDEWQDRFPELDPCDLKRVECSRCHRTGTHIVSYDLGTAGFAPRSVPCHTCNGYGWRFSRKSPLEHLAEVGMEE
jgi:DnaJ-class molecular chaperone